VIFLKTWQNALHFHGILVMINLGISLNEFLTDYWQKKPLVIRNALPSFINELSPDELAGLAMEEEIESRLVFETPDKKPSWSLKRGPFTEKDFEHLPKTHWTLLVQGVDRFIPEITSLLDNFNFLPSWRVDDVMISYAVQEGSVGPHYDNYDVFLYQAKGRRRWLLTTQDCDESNYMTDVELRIMKVFQKEHEFILEEGDMLYLPPHVGHHGISLTDDCMTYSFGFRSYKSQELWDSFGEYMAEKVSCSSLYKDPLWTGITGAGELPQDAWIEAKNAMQALLDNELLLKKWFGSFATSLDQHAESVLPLPDEENEDLNSFNALLLSSSGMVRNAVCRFVYITGEQSPFLTLYVNGCEWDIENVSDELVKKIANQREVLLNELLPFINNNSNQSFLYELWKLQWLEILD
jgi:50S ribosomal protein L16 3-hydroxylase